MSQWLYKKLLNVQTKRATLKLPHVCENCNNVDAVVRRMSILYLALYILAGVLLGIYVKWWIGLIAVYLFCFIDIKRSKPQCKKCLSHKVRLTTPQEREGLKEQIINE